MPRFYEYAYIVTLGLAGILLTAALPSSDHGVELGQSDQHELEIAKSSSDKSLGPRKISSKNGRLEKLLSEIAKYTVNEDIACESPHPQYKQTGLLPHPRSCRKFYICDQQSRKVFIYKCPPALVFSKKYGLCTIPDSVNEEDCLEQEPEADSELYETSNPRKRRSADFHHLNTSIRCELEANNAIDAIEEVDIDVRTIDSYVVHIKSLSSLEMPKSNVSLKGLDQNYRKVLNHYNADLEIAQHNTRLWRGDSGVYETISHILKEAKNFEPVLYEGFKSFLQRIGLIKNEEGKLRISTDEIITNIKRRITELEGILMETQYGTDYDTANTLLELEKQRLQTLENAYKIAETEYEFPKIINFLNFVMNNTVEIQKTVTKADRKIYEFEQKVIEDSSKFQRHHSVAMEHISALEQESNENKKLKASLPQKRRNLLRQKSSTETSLRDARSKKAEVEEQLHQLRTRSKRSPLEPLTVLAIFGGLLGAGIVAKTFIDHNAEKRNLLNQQLMEYVNMIDNLSKNVRFLKNSIDEYDKEIVSINDKLDVLQNEITYFSELLRVFQDMENTVIPVITLINKAKERIRSIGNLFLDVSGKLEVMTEDAIDAKDHLKRRSFKYFFYNEIGVMKCTWENVSAKLASLEDL